MIISHKHRFIFIKTSKTAGTSIEIALSEICGDDDVITSVSPDYEVLRHRRGGRSPQNYHVRKSAYGTVDYIKSAFGNKKKFRAHSGAIYIKNNIEPEIWDTYYKFCFERNPWDRTVSYYNFLKNHGPEKTTGYLSLPDFISTDRPYRLKKRGFYNYTISGSIAVNRVCLYENLEAELEYVCNHVLGISRPVNLPHAKGQFRSGDRDYRKILGKEGRDRIAQIFADEIMLFGYSY